MRTPFYHEDNHYGFFAKCPTSFYNQPKNYNIKLFFIEAKKTNLTLRDLGQLWAYCKLVDPEEAFLMTSAELGILNKLLNIFKREDLLDFGDGKRIKKMKVAVWDLSSKSPDLASMVPKM